MQRAVAAHAAACGFSDGYGLHELRWRVLIEVTAEMRERIWELAAEVGLCEFEDRAGRVEVNGAMEDAWRVVGSAAYYGHERLVERICALYRERFG